MLRRQRACRKLRIVIVKDLSRVEIVDDYSSRVRKGLRSMFQISRVS